MLAPPPLEGWRPSYRESWIRPCDWCQTPLSHYLEIAAKKSGWSPEVHGTWWRKTFCRHPNPEMDTESDTDYKRFFFTHKIVCRVADSSRHILCVYVFITNIDVDTNANVTCEQTFKQGSHSTWKKMRVHLENLEISCNFQKFNKYHGKMTWNLEKLGGY